RVQQATRTMDTQVDVPNPDLVLVPGMYARVDLRIEERTGALTIPVDAVERAGTTSRVLRVQDNQVHATPVTLGMETPQVFEVLSGLDLGDVVVVGRRSDIRDGQ